MAIPRRLRRVAIAATFVCACSLYEGAARADSSVPAFAEDTAPEVLRAPIITTRRHGFMIGGNLGLRFVSLSGTPLSFVERAPSDQLNLRYFGSGGSFFLGGAISDWLAIAFDLEFAGGTHKGYKVSGSAGGLRIMTWPLFYQGGIWRDLGIDATVGTGTRRVTNSATTDSAAESGSFAFAATSVFWEALRGGGFGFGPALGADVRTSDTYTEYGAWLGVRGVFYGGKTEPLAN